MPEPSPEVTSCLYTPEAGVTCTDVRGLSVGCEWGRSANRVDCSLDRYQSQSAHTLWHCTLGGWHCTLGGYPCAHRKGCYDLDQ